MENTVQMFINNKRCQSVYKDKRKKDILQFTVKNVRGASFSDTP